MIAIIVFTALIAVLLYYVFTQYSREGMVELTYSKDQFAKYDSHVNQKEIMNKNALKVIRSLLKELEQYPRSQTAMLNILDSDLMVSFEVPTSKITKLRDEIASPVGDITEIRRRIKDLEEQVVVFDE